MAHKRCWLPLEIATGKVVAHVHDRRTARDFLSFMDDVVKSYLVRNSRIAMAISCK
jgi:hypothetical protein